MKCFLLFLIIAVVYAVLRQTVGRQQRRLLILADVGLTIAFSFLILKSLIAPFLVTALSLLPISAAHHSLWIQRGRPDGFTEFRTVASRGYELWKRRAGPL